MPGNFFVTHEDLQQPASDPELVLLIESDSQHAAADDAEEQQQAHDQIKHRPHPPPAPQDPPAETS